MGIFEKTVDAIREADLQALMGVPESAILEYKRDVHDWDDIVKGLVAFANTFGGHLVIGADADRSGRMTGLPGIDRVAGFEQKVIDLCFTRVVPPVTVFPSPAIALSGTPKVAYVIHAPASYAGPHFLVHRGGAYVRVAEHSRPYEPRPAEWAELAHLADRRERAIEQRNALRRRAHDRAASAPLADGVVTEFFACPAFPVKPMIVVAGLRDVTLDPQSPGVRGRRVSDNVVAAAESIICVRPRGASHSMYYEMTTHGSIYAAAVVSGQSPLRADGRESVELLEVLADTLLWLDQARFVFERIGYEGPVMVSLMLWRMKRQTFYWGVGDEFPAQPQFDDVVLEGAETTTAAMRAGLRPVAWSLFLPIAWATDKREILTADSAALVQQAVARLAPFGITIP